MRNIKAPSKLIWGLVSFGLAVAVGLAGSESSMAQKRRPPNIILITPRAGDVLTPGDQVTISWEIDGPPGANYQSCEQEIYLSTDKGRTIATRLTPEFAYSVTSYNWTVPNLPAKKAVIIMGFGCEGGTPIFESQYPQRQSIFKISKPAAGFEEVRLAAASESGADSGKEVRLTWESSVRNVDHFEIQMSSDEGAHFQTIGLVSESNFNWHVSDEFSSDAVFRIIAHRSDGTSLESLMRSTR